MDDKIQKAIDISNLSDEQIEELYNDVLEWGIDDNYLLAGCYCTFFCDKYSEENPWNSYYPAGYTFCELGYANSYNSYTGVYCYAICK